MSEQKNESQHTSPERMAKIILQAVVNEFGPSPCPDCLRMGLGLSLSSVHSTIIADMNKQDRAQEGIDAAIDSVQRLLASMKGTLEALDIADVEFEIVPGLAPVDDTQKKSLETNLNLH